MSSPGLNPLTGERYDPHELGAFQREFEANWETWEKLILLFGFVLCTAIYVLFHSCYQLIVNGRTDWFVFSVTLVAIPFGIYLFLLLRPRLLAVAIYDDGFLARERAGETVFRWSDVVRAKEFILIHNKHRVPHLLVQAEGDVDFLVNNGTIADFVEFLAVMRQQAEDRDVEWLDLGVVTQRSEVFS